MKATENDDEYVAMGGTGDGKRPGHGATREMCRESCVTTKRIQMLVSLAEQLRLVGAEERTAMS